MADPPRAQSLDWKQRPALFRNGRVVLAIALFLSANMWFYLHRIGPREKLLMIPEEVPTSLGDLYARWHGSRELLLHHRNPYSVEVTRDIQIEYYGRPLTGAPHDPKDQQRFAYPVYVAFVFAPIVKVPFAAVYNTAKWVLPVLLLASIFAWFRFARAPLSLIAVSAIAAMTFTSIPAARGLNLQQLTIVVSAMLALCGALLVRGRYWLAGMLLALSSIRPQMTTLLTVWLMLWTLWAWRERKGLFWGFVLVMSAFLLGAEYVLPGWINDFREGLVAYHQYAAAGGILLKTYVSGPLSVVLAALVLALAAAVCWRTRHQSADSFSFVYTFCLVLVVTVLSVPAMSAVFNQVLFLPAILLALSVGERAHDQSRRTQIAWTLLWGTIILPWLAAIVVVLVWHLLPISALHRVWGLPLYASLPMPLAVLGLMVFMMRAAFDEVHNNLHMTGTAA